MKTLQQSINERIDLLNNGDIESTCNKYCFPFVDFKDGYHITFVELCKIKGVWLYLSPN